jgi:aromatic ring-opening dioxygenase catalytic subunit (LigB family)
MRAPVIAICHGGGPLPLLNDPGHEHIIKSLQTRVPSVLNLKSEQRPKAILLLTAHWETEQVTISSGSKHELYYDYYGFPSEAYQIKYDAPGDPEIAQLVSKTLAEAGIKSELDPERGRWGVTSRSALKVVSSHDQVLLF